MQQGSNVAVKLYLHKIDFPNESFKADDFANITQSIKILEFWDCEIKEISDCALNTNPFNVLYFSIIDSGITTLKRDLFCKDSPLETLQFRANSYFVDLEVEDDSFNNLISLVTLQIQNYIRNPEVIVKIAGSNTRLTKLLTIDFRFNNIQTLKANSFVSASNLQQLFLASCQIEVIESNAFKSLNALRILELTDNRLTFLSAEHFSGLSNLQTLYLQHNLLETFEEGTFKILERKLTFVDITNNNFQCICSFSWFKDYYIEMNFFNKSYEVFCVSEGSLIEETEFCEDIGSSSSSSTTSSVTSPSSATTTATNAPSSRKTKTIKCTSVLDQTQLSSDVKMEKFAKLSVNVFDDNITYNFFVTEDEDEKFLLKIDGNKFS